MPTTHLVFNVAAAGQPERPLEMVGHLFDARGRLLASAPVSEGRVAFDVDAARLSRASLYIAPVDPEGGAPTVASMRRLGAYQPTIPVRPSPAAIAVKIPEDLWRKWLFCVTRVVGKVVRPVEIGGELFELPVCHARVHICEVDPWPEIFARIPDPKILRLRDELLHVVEEPPIRLPHPDPGPLIPIPRVRLPRPVDLRVSPLPRIEESVVRVGAVSEASARIPFASLMSSAELRTLAITREAAGLDLEPAAAIRLDLPAPLRNALASPSPAVIRDALAAHTEALMPVLCWWPWIWPLVRFDEVRVVETDEHGRFEASVIYPCGGDKPDIYAWVEYCIGGSWTAVLRPPAACATRWNYVSGSELVLRVRDPRVPWCGESPSLPGKKVGVLTLGNAINVHQVDQATGLAPAGRPLGGSIEPTVWFGEQLQAGIGGTHYKWSYRRLNPDKTPVEDWIACDEREVGRHYGVIGADGKIHFKSLKLGPDEAVTSDSLFKIPPKDPPAGSWAPQLNARANTASAYLWSGSRTEHQRIPDGLYELKLELFTVSGGAPVRVKDVDFQIPPANVAAPFPTEGDLTLVSAPAAYLIKEGGHTVAFRIFVRIDNHSCGAAIHQTAVPGSTEECGFITFHPGPAASATLGFAATHANDYATFAFSLVRGRCGVGFAGASGVTGASPVAGYALDAAGVYRRTFPISQLLAPLPPGCPDGCRNGAFAEHLHVYAMATDGWGRLDYLDAHAVAAFALAAI